MDKNIASILAGRYGFEDRDVSFEEARPAIEKLRNLAVQNFIADLFASTSNGKKETKIDNVKIMDVEDILAMCQ